MSDQTRDRSEFRPSWVKAFLGFLGCLAFVAVCLFLIVEVGVETWQDAAGFGFGLLFFGAGTVVFARALFSRPARIVAEEAGLRLPDATAGTIPWDAIAQMDVQNVGGYKGFGLLLHEPQRFLKSDSAWTRGLNSLNRAQGYHISIATNGLNGSQRDIERAIQRFSGRRFPA